MDSIRRECKRSLAFVLIVMLLTSMMMSVLVLSASAEEDSHLPKVVNVPALVYSGIYDNNVSSYYKGNVRYDSNVNTKVFNMIFNDEMTDLKIQDIQSITYEYNDDVIGLNFTGNIKETLIKSSAEVAPSDF